MQGILILLQAFLNVTAHLMDKKKSPFETEISKKNEEILLQFFLFKKISHTQSHVTPHHNA